MTRGRAVRCLHVVENMDRGAVENWLVRMLRHARERGIPLDWTFYCALGRAGVLDGEARALGARVVHSPVPIRRKLAFARSLRAELVTGEYDVIHCHHDLTNALYLLAAVGAPIRRRVAHVHNADESLPTPNRLKHRIYREPMRRVCLALADRVVGISNHTLDTFLRQRHRQHPRDVVHYYGVRSSRPQPDAAHCVELREQLGLEAGAPVLLFAGRMVPEKNPEFVVDVLGELLRLEPRAVAVFAGSGLLEPAVAERAHELGISGSVRLAGWRADVGSVMDCSDCFILPRPAGPPEGFGLAVVEAQLAGLPLLISNGITDEPLLPFSTFRRLPVQAGAKLWAEEAFALLRGPKPSRRRAADELAASPMDMDRSLVHLLSLYE